jgi:hypothetical protein
MSTEGPSRPRRSYSRTAFKVKNLAKEYGLSVEVTTDRLRDGGIVLKPGSTRIPDAERARAVLDRAHHRAARKSVQGPPKRAIAALVNVLKRAGLSAHWSSGALIVNDRPVSVVLPRARATPDEVVDATVNAALGDVLLASVTDHLSGRGLPIRAVRRKRGIALATGVHVVAIVSATKAGFAFGPSVSGNFLAPGRHWDELDSRIRELLSKRADASDQTLPARGLRVLLDLPPDVAPEMRELAQVATTLIRDDRSVTFGHTVELRIDGTVIEFLPVSDERGPVEAPFKYRHGDVEVEAALRLRSPGDVLAIAVDSNITDPDIGQAWVVALAAFADLCCSQQTPTRAQAEASPSSNRRARDARTQSTAVTLRRYGKVVVGEAVQPSPATAALLASYVVGHRRRLRHGHEATQDAKRAAQAVGIALQARETWVRPHLRGAPDDIVLRFAWRPPTAISDSLA